MCSDDLFEVSCFRQVQIACRCLTVTSSLSNWLGFVSDEAIGKTAETITQKSMQTTQHIDRLLLSV